MSSFEQSGPGRPLGGDGLAALAALTPYGNQYSLPGVQEAAAALWENQAGS
jgi:hypothetical protein